MAKVYRRTRVSRSTFKKLPFNTPFWLAGGTGLSPAIKHGRNTSITGFSTDHITPLPASPNVANSTAAVVRVQAGLLTVV